MATLTVMFTDLVSSTELLSELGDEAFDALRVEHDDAVRGAIVAGGGRVVKHTGDGAMAAFTGASDSVGAAIAAQQAVSRIDRRVPYSVRVRIGLSAGDVTEEGDDLFGTPVVEARRLCDAADGGQILAAEVVRMLAGSRGGFDFAARAPLELKGLSGPVAVAVVNWTVPRGGCPLPPVFGVEPSLPLVGRDEPLERVRGAWTDVARGTCRTVFVAGEPGIGKTRLAAELAREAHAAGAIVLFGRCDDEVGAPLQPWLEALRFLVAHSDGEAVGRWAANDAPELVRLLPMLRDVLADVPRPEASDPESGRLRQFEAVASVLRRVGSDAPLLVVLDDLHWADRSSLLLLRHLARDETAGRLLIVGTYRDTDLDRRHPMADVLADLRRTAAPERVLLRGLTLAGTAALVTAYLGATPPDALVTAIHSETEGNPFFVQEVLAHLAESNALAHSELGATAARVADLGIPESVREVIGRRLSRLSDDTNRLLVAAAVLGREFDAKVLADVAQDAEDAVLERLDEARAAHLVAEVDGRFGTYSFSHALIRTTLLDEIATARRVRLHQRAAQAIEARYGADLDEHLAALAYHYGEASVAGETDRAVEFAVRAAERAAALLAHDDAVEHYRQALRALEVIDEHTSVRRYEILLAQCSAYLSGGLSEHLGIEAAAEAVEVARRLSRYDLFVRATLHSEVTFTVGRGARASRQHVQEALEFLPAGDSAERAICLELLGSYILQSGTRDDWDQAGELVAQGVAIAERVGDLKALVRARGGRCGWVAATPDSEQYLADARFVLDSSDAAGDTPHTLLPTFVTAPLLRMGRVGEVRTMIDDWEAGTRIRRDFSLAATIAGLRILFALAEGRLDDASELIEEQRQLTQGNVDSAIRLSDTALRLRWARGDAEGVVDEIDSYGRGVALFPALRLHRAAALAAAGRVDEARATAAPVMADDGGGIPWNWGRPRALHDLSDYVATIGEEPAARIAHRELVPWDGQFLVPYTPTTVDGSAASALGRAALACGDLDEADAHFTAGAEQEKHHGFHALVATTRRWHADALLRRDGPGDRDRARVLADDALADATAMGLGRVTREASTLREQIA